MLTAPPPGTWPPTTARSTPSSTATSRASRESYLETRQGFEVDGMELKARLDFAAKAIDYRGLYKNVGA